VRILNTDARSSVNIPPALDVLGDETIAKVREFQLNTADVTTFVRHSRLSDLPLHVVVHHLHGHLGSARTGRSEELRNVSDVSDATTLVIGRAGGGVIATDSDVAASAAAWWRSKEKRGEAKETSNRASYFEKVREMRRPHGKAQKDEGKSGVDHGKHFCSHQQALLLELLESVEERRDDRKGRRKNIQSQPIEEEEEEEEKEKRNKRDKELSQQHSETHLSSSRTSSRTTSLTAVTNHDRSPADTLKTETRRIQNDVDKFFLLLLLLFCFCCFFTSFVSGSTVLVLFKVLFKVLFMVLFNGKGRQ